MIDISISDIYLKEIIEDDDFGGEKLTMSVEMKGPLKYVNNDFESYATVGDVSVLWGKLGKIELKKEELEIVAAYIKDSIFLIITVCTDGNIKIDKDGVLDCAYEALEELNLVK